MTNAWLWSLVMAAFFGSILHRDASSAEPCAPYS